MLRLSLFIRYHSTLLFILCYIFIPSSSLNLQSALVFRSQFVFHSKFDPYTINYFLKGWFPEFVVNFKLLLRHDDDDDDPSQTEKETMLQLWGTRNFPLPSQSQEVERKEFLQHIFKIQNTQK